MGSCSRTALTTWHAGDASPVQVLDGPGLSGFGTSLAASGGDLAVAAANDDGNVLATFSRASDGQWSASGTVDIPAQAGGPGTPAFDLRGDLLIVGDPGANALRVFERGAGGQGWEAAGVVNAPDTDGPRGMPFGTTVALFQDEILVGQMTVEPDDDGNVSVQGVVNRFARTDGQWTAAGTLQPEDAAEREGFGMSIASDGTTLLVGGGPRLFVYGRGFDLQGTVDVFGPDDEGGVITPNQTLAMAGDVAVLGNPSVDFGLGAATVFSGDSGEWTRSAVLEVDYAGLPAISGGEVACADGGAAGYDCDHVDLLSFVPWAELGAGRGARA